MITANTYKERYNVDKISASLAIDSVVHFVHTSPVNNYVELEITFNFIKDNLLIFAHNKSAKSNKKTKLILPADISFSEFEKIIEAKT